MRHLLTSRITKLLMKEWMFEKDSLLKYKPPYNKNKLENYTENEI